MAEDLHICGSCRLEFRDINLFLEHKSSCGFAYSSTAPLATHATDTILVPFTSNNGNSYASNSNTLIASLSTMPPGMYPAISEGVGASYSTGMETLPSGTLPVSFVGQAAETVYAHPSDVLLQTQPNSSDLVPVLVKNGNTMCINFVKVNKPAIMGSMSLSTGQLTSPTYITSDGGQVTSTQLTTPVPQHMQVNPSSNFISQQQSTFSSTDTDTSDIIEIQCDTSIPSSYSGDMSHVNQSLDIGSPSVYTTAMKQIPPQTEPEIANQPEATLLIGNEEQEVDSEAQFEEPADTLHDDPMAHEGLDTEAMERTGVFMEHVGVQVNVVEQEGTGVEQELGQVQPRLGTQVLETTSPDSAMQQTQSRSQQINGNLLDPSVAMSSDGIYVSNAGAVITTVTGYDSMANEGALEAPLATDGVTTTPSADRIEQPNCVTDYSAQLDPIASKKLLTALPRRFPCSRCTQKFQYKKDLDRHFRIHTGDKPYQCQYCEKRFSRTDKRRIHERSHTGDKPYKCPHCSYKAGDASSLKAHILIHQDLKPHKCQMCSYAARTSNALTVHLRVHTGDSPYVCYVCQSSFKIKSDLSRHLRIHNGDKPYQCDFCDYRCSMKGNLRSHVTINHCREKMQRCDQCDYETSSSKRYTTHLLSHSLKGDHFPPPLNVKEIAPRLKGEEGADGRGRGRGTAAEDEASRPGSRKMKCSTCSFTCANKMAMMRHKKTHMLSSPHECTNCTYSAPTRRALREHTRNKHKPRAVGKAAKKPPRQAILNVKKPLALCEKTFKCTKCDAAFVRNDSLRCHMRNHIETEKVMAMTVLELQNPFTLTPDSDTMLSQAQEGLETSVIHLKDSQPLYEDVPVSKSTRGADPTDDQSDLSYPAGAAAGGEEDMHGLGGVGSSSVDTDTESERNTAVLSQAASNLLAFMENQQNHAMEDNMVNLARQRALNAATGGTNSYLSGSNRAANNSGATHANAGRYGSRSGHTVRLDAMPTLDAFSQNGDHHISSDAQEVGQRGNVVVRQVHSWNHGSTGLLSLAEQALDTDGDMLLSNNDSLSNSTTSFRSRITGSESVDSPSGCQSSQLPESHAAPCMPVQSSWEQLQQAVLQSVSLQSPTREQEEGEEEAGGRSVDLSLQEDTTPKVVPVSQPPTISQFY